MSRPIVTLTTDFGEKDYFVAAMKGVILSISSNAEIVDVSHQITPFEITEAAFVVDQASRCFPQKTVHVVVVDPGVGSARRPLLVEAGGQYFVGPDNGVFAMVMSREKWKAREVTAERFFRQPVSQTFHGRDVFAPVAAHLSNNTPAARFGKLVDNALRPGLASPQRTGKRTWSGVILAIDRFGNIITNLNQPEFAVLSERPFELRVGLESITQRAANYSAMPIGVPFAIWGSAGYLEVAMNQSNAAKQLGVGAGAPVDLTVF